MNGILGKKLGMTEVFSTSGKLTPVTVIKVEPNVVTQVKTNEKDGYIAIQLASETVREKVSNKPKMGVTKKAKTTPKRFLREIRNVNTENINVGDEVKADIFTVGEMVDVTGTTKGKGFQGVIKRHNQHIGPKSHGSHFHRRPGSMGPMLPMRVLKGKNLPGQMGGDKVTIQNLEIVSIDLENNVILVKGNVPGAKNSLVIIKTAVKNQGKINKREELVSYEEVVEVPTEEVVVSEPINVETSVEVEKALEEEIEETAVEEETTEKVIENGTAEAATEEVIEEVVEESKDEADEDALEKEEN